MHDHTTDPSNPEAWGDIAMPAEAQQRQAQLDDIASQGAVAGQLPAATPSSRAATDGSPSRAYNGATASGGHDRSAPQLDYSPPSAGPGGEAMRDGTSPAPRGFTGGAMGKFVAGLSPSFAAAASGTPPPGGPSLYTGAEASTTFGSAHSAAPATPTEPTGEQPEHSA